jgi:integrase
LYEHRLNKSCRRIRKVFETSEKTPLSLHNVVNRQILPTLEAEREKAKQAGKKSGVPEWYGFHAARRTVGSNLNRLGFDDSFIQKILRHSTLSTTQTYYIKTSDEDKALAMKKLEAEIARVQAEVERLKSLRDSVLPAPEEKVKKPEFVS